MKRLFLAAAVVAGWWFVAPPAVRSQLPAPHALTMRLECAWGDCPLLKGAPETAGMRSGYVQLKPGQTVGWHTTGSNEESLVILSGRGEARLEGQPAMPFEAPMLVYIPPDHRHNVANTGKDLLEYVYVVAPAKPSQR